LPVRSAHLRWLCRPLVQQATSLCLQPVFAPAARLAPTVWRTLRFAPIAPKVGSVQ
jgi:ATP adenylyltransferase/5',5'''-P-1,P-4-tetraphosphate phosphorylase II